MNPHGTPAPESDRRDPSSTDAPLHTGLPLHVVEVDHPDQPTGPDAPSFLFLHGFGGSSFTWRHWAPRMAARGRVVLVDLKGFGDAPKPDDDAYTPADQAGYVVDLIQRLNLRKLTLVGHSLGGGISLLVALRLLDDNSGRLSRLVLVAAAAYRQRLPPAVTLSRLPRLLRAVIRVVGPKRVVRGVLKSIVYDRASISEEQVRAYATPLETWEGVRAAMAAAKHIMPVDLDEVSARYPELDIPTLALWGDSDRVIPLWVGRRLAEEIPLSSMAVLAKCGHIPPEELPEVSLRMVEAFLDRHPVP